MPDDFSGLLRKHSDVIKRYKSQYPMLSNTMLATVILSKENLKTTVGRLRQAIPYVIEEVKPDVSLDDSEFTIEIPDTLYRERERFIIPTAIDKMLFISDLHLPYHDINAIKLAIKYGYDNGMRGIFLGGDVIDFYGISRYLRLPHLRNIKQEVEATRQFLTNLRQKFPSLEIYYKKGNHEQRYEKYLMSVAPELFDLDSIQFEEVMKLNQLNIRLIDDLTVTEFGRLNIIHGQEIFGGGINVSRNFRIKAADNILFGHFHRSQEDLHKTIKGKVMGAWSVGCMCGLAPDYMPINNWNLGFAFITRNHDGNFTVENKKIIGGFIH